MWSLASSSAPAPRSTERISGFESYRAANMGGVSPPISLLSRSAPASKSTLITRGLWLCMAAQFSAVIDMPSHELT